ncbi:MAG TPA: cytochrome c4 [Burkholderiales bacterium]|nr:cytochrome c4 [Burkholderiales bacterium]
MAIASRLGASRGREALGLAVMLLAGLASSPRGVDAQEPAKVPNTIEQRMQACAICHGKQGEGIQKNEYYPRLAGKPAVYLYNQLLNFRERRRDVPIMTYMVAYLSEPYLREIAEYYANLHPPFPAPAAGASKEVLARGEKLVTAGDPAREVPACAECHGKALTGLLPAIPGIVGLNRDYIAAQMGGWKIGQRNAEAPDCMAQVAKRLTPEDIFAVTAWLAAQPASPDTPPAPAESLRLPLKCGGVN